MALLRGERNGSRSGESLRQPGEHREVSVKLHTSKPANAEWSKSVPVLQGAELSFHRRATPVQVTPPLRLAWDERMEAGGLPPDGLRLARTCRAAPLGRAALGVGACERPSSVLTLRSKVVAALHE